MHVSRPSIKPELSCSIADLEVPVDERIQIMLMNSSIRSLMEEEESDIQRSEETYKSR